MSTPEPQTPGWFMVWIDSNTGPVPQVWAFAPASRSPETIKAGPKILKDYPIRREHLAEDGMPRGLHSLVEHYPAPAV